MAPRELLQSSSYEARRRLMEGRRQLLGQIEGPREEMTQPGIPAGKAVAWLRSLARTSHAADLQVEKAELLRPIYDRIVREAGA